MKIIECDFQPRCDFHPSYHRLPWSTPRRASCGKVAGNTSKEKRARSPSRWRGRCAWDKQVDLGNRRQLQNSVSWPS